MRKASRNPRQFSALVMAAERIGSMRPSSLKLYTSYRQKRFWLLLAVLLLLSQMGYIMRVYGTYTLPEETLEDMQQPQLVLNGICHSLKRWAAAEHAITEPIPLGSKRRSKKMLEETFARFLDIPDSREGDAVEGGSNHTTPAPSAKEPETGKRGENEPHENKKENEDEEDEEEEEGGRTASIHFFLVTTAPHSAAVTTSVLSALVAGIPMELVVLEEAQVQTNPYYRWKALQRLLNASALKDEDVVMVTDGDVLFTGRDVLPMMEEFLATTARSAAEMDVRKVRANQLRAPFLLQTEETCYLPSAVDEPNKCIDQYSCFENLKERWVNEHNYGNPDGVVSVTETTEEPSKKKKSKRKTRAETSTTEKPLDNEDQEWLFTKDPYQHRNKRVFPGNGEVFVARVWALKEVLHAALIFVLTRYPADNMITVWTGGRERSIVPLLHAELVRYEVSSGLLSNRCYSSAAEVIAHSPFFLTPGVLGMDYRQEFILSLQSPHTAFLNGREITDFRRENAVKDALGEVIAHFTKPESDPQNPKRTDAPLQPDLLSKKDLSPTGVYLTPLRFTADVNTVTLNYLPLYNNWSLSGADGRVDISVPLPNGIPLGYHFNSSQAEVRANCTAVLPWVAPLLTEGSTRLHNRAADSSSREPREAGQSTAATSPLTLHSKKQPQLTALLEVIHNAPPLRMWRDASSALRTSPPLPGENAERKREEERDGGAKGGDEEDEGDEEEDVSGKKRRRKKKLRRRRDRVEEDDGLLHAADVKLWEGYQKSFPLILSQLSGVEGAEPLHFEDLCSQAISIKR